MGMGEPFHNYDAVMEAVALLNDAQGFGLGHRHITISTVGLVDKIERFADERLQVNLAISLHAPNDALRSRHHAGQSTSFRSQNSWRPARDTCRRPIEGLFRIRDAGRGKRRRRRAHARSPRSCTAISIT